MGIKRKHSKRTGRAKTKKTVKKKAFQSRKEPKPTPLEERLLDLSDEADEADHLFSPDVSEKMRSKLLKEEFKLRKKQPTAWTKTKYRKFAMFAFNRKKKDEKEGKPKNEDAYPKEETA